MAQLSSFLLFNLIWSVHLCYGIPIHESLEDIPNSLDSVPGFVIYLVSAATVLLVSYILIACVCCPNKSIKALTYQNGFPVNRLNDNGNPSQFDNQNEFAIFPPRSAVIDLQPVGQAGSPSNLHTRRGHLTLPSGPLTLDGNQNKFAVFPPPSAVIDLQPVGQGHPFLDDKVHLEPLPDILSRGQSAACSSRPAHFRTLLNTKVSLYDWFDDPNSNFPRDQLQYIRELGSGWFGRVVEGHTCSTDGVKTAAIVKILQEEASPSEHLHFLHEVRPYRDLSHPNVIRLLGRCLESDPFLLIMEHSISDMKTYLLQQENKDGLLKYGINLQMACNVAAGLRCLHENGFTHMDFAAHNCFVCSDNSVKVGDYGTSFDRCREDYYCLGEIALPIRWCSPETLQCTEATIETKEITREANIWAFGVVLWEIFEFGKLPYEDLTNEQVLQKVLIDQTVTLPPPSMDFPIKLEMTLIMKECWKVANSRPPMEKVEKFLTRLYNDCHNLKTLEETCFEERWEALQSKVTEVPSVSSDRISLKFENDFSERSSDFIDAINYSTSLKLDNDASDGERFSSFDVIHCHNDAHNCSSDGERFSSFEASYDVFSKNINGQLSPSLRVLNGSIDELTENDICSVSIGYERSASATSDHTLSNLDDDLGSQVGEIVTSVTVRDMDPGSDVSKHQLNSYNNNINSEYFAEVLETSKHQQNLYSNSQVSDSLPFIRNQNSAVPPNLEEFKAVDNNYNELPFIHENSNRIHAVPKEPNIYPEEVASNISHLNRPRLLSSVPDIVVHESPSVLESSHDENENIVPELEDETPTNESPRGFRFVFKGETTADSQHNRTSNDSDLTPGSQNTPDSDNISSAKPLIMKGRSHPLTSTPLKSNHETNIGSSPESFSNPDDSGNVFYTNSISEIGTESSENKTPPKPTCEVADELKLQRQHDIIADKIVPDTKSSSGTVYFEAPSSRTDTTFRTLDSNALVENISTSSCDPQNFVSAQSTFVYNSDAISKTLTEGSVKESSLANQLPDVNKIENGKVVVVNIPTLSVEEENDCALSSAESLDKDYKWPSLQEAKSDSNSDAYIGDKKSSTKEDLLSLDYGEPVTPDVSFNVSTCSYERDGRTFSTSSPGISSENAKDSEESDCEHSGLKKHQSRNQHHLEYDDSDCETSSSKRFGSRNHQDKNYVAAEANTCPNNWTLSEASSAEFLDSYSPASDSYGHSDENRMESAGNQRGHKSGFHRSSFNHQETGHKTDLFYAEDDDLEDDSDLDAHRKGELRLNPYDEVIVEDLETGEQTIITESFSTCDDYENSAESDDILKINTETDEAIIVDSSEALVGFVPSRSIEMLNDCHILSNANPLFNLEEERESSDSNHLDAPNSASSSPALFNSHPSPSDSPYQPPTRTFPALQNEVIEEEITEEIPSSTYSPSAASFSSCELEDRMSRSSPELEDKYSRKHGDQMSQRSYELEDRMSRSSLELEDRKYPNSCELEDRMYLDSREQEDGMSRRSYELGYQMSRSSPELEDCMHQNIHEQEHLMYPNSRKQGDRMSQRSYELEDKMSRSSPKLEDCMYHNTRELGDRLSQRSYELEEDQMSRSSSSGGSPARRVRTETEETTSVMPSAELYYGEDSPECSPGRSVQSDEYEESDEDASETSPLRRRFNNTQDFPRDSDNNHRDDVMHSLPPTHPVRWRLDDTLDVALERDNSPVILEGQEILAGGMLLETKGMSVKDITSALHRLEAEEDIRRHHLDVSRSPSPYGSGVSSVESSPCRGDAYTPDFESSDSTEDEGPSSCSSTSGSFECIHNKFKSVDDVSAEPVEDEEDPPEEEDDSSQRPSPLKIFSTTWDCHATPTKGVLVTPEKKFSSMRKSVSFHEEDPQVVFEYPPCSDSEDGPPSDDFNPWKVDYKNYADWELQMGDNEEIEEVLEIEELDSEPYVRRPTYGIGSSVGPMNRPMLYSLTSGFSDDDMDFSDPIPVDSVAPSNSPEEGKQPPLSEDEIGNLIRNQLNNLALEESRLKWVQDVFDHQPYESSFTKADQESERSRPISEHDIEFDEILPKGEMFQISNDLHGDGFDIFPVGKPVEEPFSKLRLSTLATLEEARDIPMSRDSNTGVFEVVPDVCSSGVEVYGVSVVNDKECVDLVECVPDLVSFENKAQVYEVNSLQNSSLVDCVLDKSPKSSDILSMDETALEFEDSATRPGLKSCTIPETEVNEKDEPIKDKKCTASISQMQNTEDGVMLYNESTNHDFKIPFSNLKSDLFQTTSLEFESKDSVNSSGAFLLLSNASSMLDFPDINGSSEKKYFDLNDSSIVHTESDASDFLSSLEIKKENDLPKADLEGCLQNGSRKQEEIIPTLDFLNSEMTVMAPIVSLDQECNISFTDVIPLTMKEGNKRPNSLPFKVPYSEGDIFENEHSLKLSEKESEKELHTNSSNKDILSPMPSKNIKDIENFNLYAKSESDNDLDLLQQNQFDDNDKNIADELFSETKNSVINSKIKDETAGDTNKDNQNTEIFSTEKPSLLSKFDLITSQSVRDSDQLKNTSEDKYTTISTEHSSLIGKEHDCSFSVVGNDVKEIIHSTGAFENDKNCYPVSEGEESLDLTSTTEIESTNDFSTNPAVDSSNVQNNDCVSISMNATSAVSVDKNYTDSPENVTMHAKNNPDHQTVEKLENNEVNPIKDSEVASEYTKMSDNSENHPAVKESALDSLTETEVGYPETEKSEQSVPKIVVSPASESEIEDELEEYLRNQLKFGYGPEDDFSVTSQFSVGPFEEVFKTHENVPGNSRDYVEAYNFEFEDGDFFDDFSVDHGEKFQAVGSTAKSESSPL
ncbi:hypothetical protein JTE90_000459 [Oedothorax gibbosus]|uniref:Protein kinase domain-containing protein n=1 Tax=Oedothorax gibbosus TaxID=931172 RepID=A0AAV6U2R1_9ARAC|nr:hypothetical protein JTE90_000459 [Oedothorax gibbosus]